MNGFMRLSTQMNWIDDCKIVAFSVPVWGLILKEEKYHVFNYIEEIEELRANSLDKIKYGTTYESDLNLQENGVFRELIENLTNIGNNIVLDHFKLEKKLIMSHMWANVNTHMGFNYGKMNTGFLTGILHLKVDNDTGSLMFTNPFTHYNTLGVVLSDMEIKPEPLSCFIFPSWLEYYVMPNLSTESRISISFNFNLGD